MAISSSARFSIIAGLSALCCGGLVSAAIAADLLTETAPVAQHVKRAATVRFAPSDTAVEFNNFQNKLPIGAGSYDVLPSCSESNVRRLPVVVDSQELKFFDLLLYNYRDAEQSRRAESWERPAAPFLEGDLHNPHRNKGNLQQNLGRFFDIRCLPTRVHYVYQGGRRYEEYREGLRAWDPES